jgi:hypothetical protein
VIEHPVVEAENASSRTLSIVSGLNLSAPVEVLTHMDTPSKNTLEAGCASEVRKTEAYSRVIGLTLCR